MSVQEIKIRIARLEAQLAAANDTLDSAVGNEILEYRFDSGEGSQRVEYKTMQEIAKIVEWLESRIEYLKRRLNGSGLSNMNMRRKQHYNRGW